MGERGNDSPPRCPCCGRGRLTPFYRLAGVPRDPTPLATYAAGVGAPCRSVTLGICRACGFVQSVAGDGVCGAPPRERPAGDDPREIDVAAASRVCRDRFAHVRRPLAFLARLHGAISCHAKPGVTVRVPDAMHALGEGAFWLACRDARSQFTPGSAARLLRGAGFDVTDLRRHGGNEMFELDARPAAAPTPMRFDWEDDLAAVLDAADGFDAAAHRQAARWRRVIVESAAEEKRVVVWGSPATAAAFLAGTGLPVAQVPVVVAGEPDAAAGFLPGTGRQVVPPCALTDVQPDIVILLDEDRRGEVGTHVRGLDPKPQILSP